MFNAASTATWGHGRSRPQDTDSLALGVRVTMLAYGARNLERLICSVPTTYFRSTDAYDGKTFDEAVRRNMSFQYETEDDETYKEGAARALLVLAFKSVKNPRSEGSNFCLPLLADILRVKVRCYHPGNTRS